MVPLANDDVAWIAPPKEECDEETFSAAVDVENLISVRRVEWNGQLVQYAVVHSRKDPAGNWVEVSSIDTFHHGSVHRHRGPHSTTKFEVIREITSQDDVQKSFKASYDEVYDSYLESIEGSAR